MGHVQWERSGLGEKPMKNSRTTSWVYYKFIMLPCRFFRSVSVSFKASHALYSSEDQVNKMFFVSSKNGKPLRFPQGISAWSDVCLAGKTKLWLNHIP